MKAIDELIDAIIDGDINSVERIVDKSPQVLNKYPYVSGSWLEFSASEGQLEILKLLVAAGLDVNALGQFGESRAIDGAAIRGHLIIVKYLIEAGSILDVSDTTCNPLLNAIIGGSLDVVKELLDNGIDASVKYSHAEEADATAFALIRGQKDIANYIARHLSNGDESRQREILFEARKIANLSGPLIPVHIIPFEKDFIKN